MHPISLMMAEVRRIFEDIGFSAVEGPDIEDDWHVFTALNFAEEHPARDMQDTFFVDDKLLIMSESASAKYIFGNFTGGRSCYATDVDKLI